MKIPSPADLLKETKNHWATCGKRFQDCCWTCALHYAAMNHIARSERADKSGLYVQELYDRTKAAQLAETGR